MGKDTDAPWSYGDIEAGFKKASLILDETFVTPNTSHQCLESRTSMAYWQNGKLFIHLSTQSAVQTVMSVVRWLSLEPENVVVISEYCGGGYGSKGTGSVTDIIPALLAKKTGTPVQMRISREEEHGIGGARPALHGRMKVGFTKEGRVTALDMFTVVDGGPYGPGGDGNTASRFASLMFQPEAMRWRGVTAITNTPPRRAQSQPGGMQGIVLMEPVIAKAARQLGIDQVEIRKINAPAGKAKFGPANAQGNRTYSTSCFIKEALDKGAQIFKWDERKARSGQRQGSKVRGSGVAISSYNAGSVGFDGLFVIKPDGRMYIQTGIGNLGTESWSDCQRVSAEMMGMPWEKVEITWGDTSKNLPWSCVSGGSQTTHAMTRAAHAAASDAIKKLQQIAAKDLGGRPEDYVVANERVSRKGGGAGMTLAHAAQRAIELGGIYDGHEVPKEINAFTKRSAAALAGQGLMGVARDAYPHDGNSLSFVASFAEVEVDVETGVYRIVDFLAVADVGTVIHPAALGGQILGRSMLGIAHAIGQKWVYDQHYGVALAKRFHHNKPPTILDAPTHMDWAAVELPELFFFILLSLLRHLPNVPLQQTPDILDAPPHGLGGGRASGSGDAGWRARHWRASGRGRLRGGAERDFCRAGRRSLPPRACEPRRYSHGAGGGKTDDGPAHCQRVRRLRSRSISREAQAHSALAAEGRGRPSGGSSDTPAACTPAADVPRAGASRPRPPSPAADRGPAAPPPDRARPRCRARCRRSRRPTRRRGRRAPIAAP